ncbi:MAG: TonB-dependent receptor, partial [Acidobacteria bacterium]
MRTSNALNQAALLLLICSCTLATAPAQISVVNATAVGTVVDEKGGVLPGVTVRITNVGTNITEQAVTDGEGRYRIGNLPPGDYRLEAELTGFKTAIVKGVKLEVKQTARYDLTLTIGQISDKVEVVGEVALLKADSAEIGSVVYERMIKELPLNGRNYLQLAYLTPGATTGSEAYGGYYGSTAGTYNGLSSLQNEYQLDGGMNTSLDLITVAVRPPVDAIREFKVETTSYSAEFGRAAGAVISAVTKSGTNEFHGGLWEFFRNDKLDARDFFSGTKPPYRQNQYGAMIGGPILKDKLFFFGSWEGSRIRQGVNQTATVPTALERAGDFSQSTRFGASQIYDPFNLDATGQRTLFPGGKIPTSRFNAVAAKALSYYPLPNIDGFPNYRVFPSIQQNNDKALGRVDYKPSDKNTFFGRYAWETEPRFEPAAIPLM